MAAALYSRANAASRTILDRVKGMKLGRAQTMVLTDSFSLTEQDVRVFASLVVECLGVFCLSPDS